MQDLAVHTYARPIQTLHRQEVLRVCRSIPRLRTMIVDRGYRDRKKRRFHCVQDLEQAKEQVARRVCSHIVLVHQIEPVLHMRHNILSGLPSENDQVLRPHLSTWTYPWRLLGNE